MVRLTDTTGIDPIRVCFVAPKAYPLFNPAINSVFGGAEVDLYHIATELAKSPAFEVSFITADYGQKSQENIENITVLKSLKLEQHPLIGALKIWRCMKKARADVYMIKTASLGVPLVSLFCRLNNKRFVYRTAHQSECDGTYTRDNMISGRLFASGLKRADLLFTQNNEDRANLKLTLGLESIVIPNGHRVSSQMLAERHSILWVGRSARFKHPELFLELAKKFPSERFVMICQRAEEDTQYEMLRNKADSLPNVEFIPRVSFKNIDPYFVSAKVLVNTSDSEGFSNTFTQACKAATPIVSYQVNPDEFLTKYNCGIHSQGSFEKMEKALHYLLTNDRYLEIGINGRKLLEQRYDIRMIIEEYKKYFRHLMEGNSTCAG